MRGEKLPALALVLAVDETDPARARALCAAAAELDGLKLGVAPLLAGGPALAAAARQLMGEKPILFDLKIADIGFAGTGGRWEGTNSRIIAAAAGLGADLVTIHGLHGVAALLESAAAARERGLGALLLPFMTQRGAGLAFAHPLDREHLARELAPFGLAGCLEGCANFRDLLLRLGEKAEVAGYIGPANQAEVLAAYRRFTARPIWAPGFGRQERGGRDLAVQLRDFRAAAGESCVAIVGTSVTGAADPLAAARELRRLRDGVRGERQK